MKREDRGLRFAPQWKRIGLATGAGVLTLLTAAGAAAGLIGQEVIELESRALCAAAGLLLAGFVAGRTGGAPGDGALAVLGVAVVLLALNFGLYGGTVEGLGASVLALAGGCGASMLLRGRSSGGRNSRRRRKIVKLNKRRSG